MTFASDAAHLPVLYSFRRCPYAMRARLAVMVSGTACELREVALRNKPEALCQVSAKATVPVLVDVDDRVIDQSLDIMRWALARNDPAGWLTPSQGNLADMLDVVALVDGDLKFHLDRYKYPGRYADANAPTVHRAAAAAVLGPFADRLRTSACLFGPLPCLADMAIAPFVRQFAHVDPAWFATQPWPEFAAWLAAWEASPLLASVMQKMAPWQPGTPGVRFG